MKTFEPLAAEVHRLTEEIHRFRTQIAIEFDWCKSQIEFATKQMENKIMSAVSDWAAEVNVELDRVQTGLDAVQALVAKLQATPGAITPEDQALLDQIEAKVNAIAADAETPLPQPPVA
jgi:cell division septum initiation protein DivIVA